MQSYCTSINSVFENILISMFQNGFLIEQERVSLMRYSGFLFSDECANREIWHIIIKIICFEPCLIICFGL